MHVTLRSYFLVLPFPGINENPYPTAKSHFLSTHYGHTTSWQDKCSSHFRRDIFLEPANDVCQCPASYWLISCFYQRFIDLFHFFCCCLVNLANFYLKPFSFLHTFAFLFEILCFLRQFTATIEWYLYPYFWWFFNYALH